MTPVTVITGASSGIGAELAHVFAEKGHSLVLVARREQHLNVVADEIAAKGLPRPFVLPFDLALPHAATWVGRALAFRAFEPQYIVNNAGFGLVGQAADLDRTEQLGMIDLNMRALTDLSLSFVDSLSRHRGGILNVASIAGVMPGPGSAVYYASKAFVLSLSEALHSELKPRGIRVTCLCPGPVPTEFHARAGIPEAKPSPTMSQPARLVAAAGYAGLMRGQRMVVPGAVPKLLAFLAPRFMPRRLLLALVARRQARRQAQT